MKKLISVAMLTIVLIGLTACGGDLPEKPSLDEVKKDIEMAAANVLIGEVADSEENILFETVIVEELELTWVEGEQSLVAEITAFVGNEHWKSEQKASMKLNYHLNSDGEWEPSGTSWDKIVIPIKPRE